MAQKWPPSSDDFIITSSHHHDITSSHHPIIASRDATYALKMASYHNRQKIFGGANQNACVFCPPTGAYRIFWFQLFLLWQPSKLPKPMKNPETVGNRRFSNKESHLPFLCRLRRRAKIFRNLGIFEKTPIDESLNPPGGTP